MNFRSECEPTTVEVVMNDWDVTSYAAKDYLVSIGVDGLSYAQEDVSGLSAVIEFDPGSLVLTAFGRVNAGTIRGDRAVADRFLNSFFWI
jgi:hypothetical protein